MKVKTLILLAAFSLPVFKVDAQQKEWHNLLALLQKEAAYFQGKNGFIQLEKSDYNTFSITKTWQRGGKTAAKRKTKPAGYCCPSVQRTVQKY